MAVALIKGYSGEFNPEQFKDLYQERIHKIIEQTRSGNLQLQSASQKPASPVPDLMESIRLSLAEIESKKSESKPSKKPARKAAAVAKRKPQKARA
jgi:DNA end-binding protein Ku